MKRSRIVLGLLLAPSVLPVAYMLLSLLLSGYPFGMPVDQFFLELAAIAGVCYGASYLLGVPVVAGLLLARRLTFLPCALLSTAVGAVAAAVAYVHYRESGVETGFAALLGGGAAFLVACVFCLIARVPWRKAVTVSAA